MADSDHLFQNCIEINELEAFPISLGITLVVFLYLFIEEVVESFRIFQGLDFSLCFEAEMREGEDGRRVCTQI